MVIATGEPRRFSAFFMNRRGPTLSRVLAADPLTANVGGEQRGEPVPPVPHRLMAKIDAALEQEIFDVPQAEREAYGHENHQPDNLQ